MTPKSEKGKIKYVKPGILDLGAIEAVYGACTNGDGATGCDPAGGTPGADCNPSGDEHSAGTCSNGGYASGACAPGGLPSQPLT